MAFLRNTLCIDFGTKNIKVYIKAKGVNFTTPSIVARDSKTKKIIAAGIEAKNIMEKTTSNIEFINPFKRGVIFDFNASEAMFKYIIKRAMKKTLFKPIVCISSNDFSTEIQKKALIQACKNAGAIKCILINSMISNSYGFEEKTKLNKDIIIDFGASATSIAYISNDTVIKSNYIDLGGNDINFDIREYVKAKYQANLSINTVENIKQKIANANILNLPMEMEISARDIKDGLPKLIKINSNDVHEAISFCLSEILLLAKSFIYDLEEIDADTLISNGIKIVGGGALLNGIDTFLEHNLKVNIINSENAIINAVKGLSKIALINETIIFDLNKIFMKNKELN